MYHYLLPDVAAERIADRRREAASRGRERAAGKASSAPAASRDGRRGLRLGRRAAACENS